jgi:hypothetical protein
MILHTSHTTHTYYPHYAHTRSACTSCPTTCKQLRTASQTVGLKCKPISHTRSTTHSLCARMRWVILYCGGVMFAVILIYSLPSFLYLSLTHTNTYTHIHTHTHTHAHIHICALHPTGSPILVQYVSPGSVGVADDWIETELNNSDASICYACTFVCVCVYVYFVLCRLSTLHTLTHTTHSLTLAHTHTHTHTQAGT